MAMSSAASVFSHRTMTTGSTSKGQGGTKEKKSKSKGGVSKAEKRGQKQQRSRDVANMSELECVVVIRAVMLFVKQRKSAVLSACSTAFCKWRFVAKHTCAPLPPPPPSLSFSSTTSNFGTRDALLQMFAENEKLALGLKAAKAQQAERERELRHQGAKSLIVLHLRNRVFSKLSLAFHTWKASTQTHAHEHSKALQRDKQAISEGTSDMQRLHEEAQAIGEQNTKLRIELLIALFFLQLRAYSAAASLAHERKHTHTQQHALLKEVRRLRIGMEQARGIEQELARACVSEGEGAMKLLDAKSRLLHKVLIKNKQVEVATASGGGGGAGGGSSRTSLGGVGSIHTHSHKSSSSKPRRSSTHSVVSTVSRNDKRPASSGSRGTVALGGTYTQMTYLPRQQTRSDFRASMVVGANGSSASVPGGGVSGGGASLAGEIRTQKPFA